MATTSKLRLVPVTGKYCQVNFGGKKYEIWRQFPGTEKKKDAPKGTAVDYNIAVQLLCLQPPVVALVPKVEDGKFVSQVSEKDLALIKEAQFTGQTMISNAFTNLSEPAKESSKDESQVIATLKAQNESLQQTIQAQNEAAKAQNEAFQAKLDALTAQVAVLTQAKAPETTEDGEAAGKETKK